MDPTAIRRFNKLCLSTLIAVYILIAVGSIVRVTGSGMGCPDWPKCFGSFIPPTSIEQLPKDYKANYSALRQKKNIRFARYLSAFGMKGTAGKLLNDKSVLEETEFNPLKTWIEYVNRLVGVIIGFFIIALAWQSRKFRQSNSSIFWTSLALLLLVIFQGWFGSIVVSTNLTTWTITVHMFLAVLMALLIVSLQSKTESSTTSRDNKLALLAAACIVLLFVQVFLGTEVRAAIDRASVYLFRGEWIANLGKPFVIHRTFSWVVMLFEVILIVKIRKTGSTKSLSLPLIILILGAFFSGVGMAYFGVPAVLQPLHLTLAIMAIGTEALLMFRLTNGSN